VQKQQLTAFSQCVSIRFSNEYFLPANVTGDGRRAWMVPERSFQVYYGRKKMGEIIDKSKGKIKQAVADVTGNKKLKREGERDELKGRVKGVVKDVKRAVKGAVK